MSTPFRAGTPHHQKLVLECALDMPSYHYTSGKCYRCHRRVWIGPNQMRLLGCSIVCCSACAHELCQGRTLSRQPKKG